SAKEDEKAAVWNPETLAASLKDPLAEAIDGAVSKSMQQLATVVAREMKAAAPKQDSTPAAPAPEVLADAVREAVSEGVSAPLQKSMDALSKELKQAMTYQKASPQGPSAEEIGGAIRDSLSEVLASTAKSITKEIQALQAAQGSAPDPSAYTEAMQTALAGALKEAVVPFSKSVEAQRAQEDERLRALQEAFEAQAKEASQTGRAMQAAMKELLGALTAQQKEAGSGAADGQLKEAVSAAREAAEAAKQAVEAMQNVQTPPRHPFAPAGGTGAAPSVKGAPGAINAGAQADEAAVTPFPGQHKGAGDTSRGEKDVLEAMESPGAKTRSDARVREALESEHPQGAHTFDRFFVSKANQFAFAMAQAVAQEPGGEYSPFYIHGDVGVGKTHLINAIANGVRVMDPDRRVGYVTASRFAERLEEALHRHEAANVRHAYAQWDVLVVDDVQFLAGRTAAQEELFHILNALEREDRQIIIAGAAAPANLTGVDKGLISRFNGGIVSALEAPDHATRVAILEHQAAAAGAQLPRQILEVIASRVPYDMRKMTGALRKVIAFAGLAGQELDSAQGLEILDQLGITEAA
ncbi:MAG: DnaA ATPase domain-containing protein, partial [Candidatus Hydrogenedentota bacterium]